MSPLESVMQWYIWAGKELHISYETVDKMSVNEFFDMVLLYDKMSNPNDYIPAEEIFRP